MKMNVSIISFGKFHSFDLARELKSNNMNISLYSSYPYFISKKYNIKYSEHYSFFILQLIDRITGRRFSNLLIYLFSYLLSFSLKSNQDFFIIWSDIPNFLLKFIRKKYNSIVILERGSSHIEHQNKLLKEEYQRFNKNFSISKKTINNELKNYADADYISIPSKFSYKSFISHNISKTKLIVNPYGSDISKFFKKSVKRDKKFTIMTCGKASIQKGFHYLLDSYKYINKDFIHVHVGSVEDIFINKIKSIKNLKIYDSVNHEKLVNFYNMSDVFILPSIQDGFGMVILEAMSCGIPIIATENTGITSISSFSDFGFAIKIKDPKEIAEKINYLISNPLKRHEMSECCQKAILKKGYKWEDYGTRYYFNLKKVLELYQQR